MKRGCGVGVGVALLLASVVVASRAEAFCGFYVSGGSGADAKLYADATQVVLMREGTRTVLSMQNDYKGPLEKFAMVIPVPVVLAKENVKTLPHDVFDKIDKLGSPRLVEYWEKDPCDPATGAEDDDSLRKMLMKSALNTGVKGGLPGGDLGVKVEAKFAVGEYEIVILSAKDAAGLDTWLKQAQYNIPDGAEPFLRPYVASGMKFFVAKVDTSKVKFIENSPQAAASPRANERRAALSPIRFHYDADTFSLPVRLGLINSGGMQDLIVNILAKETRYEVANYPNVTIPTNLDVAEAARGKFGEFYAALFDKTIEQTKNAVVTEYAWDAGTCDPCPGPTLDGNDLATFGADAAVPSSTQGLRSGSGGGSGRGGEQGTSNGSGSGGLPPNAGARAALASTVKQGNVQVNGRGLTTEVIQRVVRASFARFGSCYDSGLRTNPQLAGGRVTVKLVITKEGAVGDVSDGGGDLADEQVKTCVRRAFAGLTFPQPEGGGTVNVVYPLIFAPPNRDAGPSVAPSTPSSSPSPSPSSSSQPAAFISPGPYVLTRLHARYDKAGMGQDLVFKAVGAIGGGREVRSTDGNKALEKGSHPESRNNFQARYAIRHPWTEPIACKEPKRGVWGGPRADGGVGSGPIAAQKIAFAPRGGLALATMLSGASVADALGDGGLIVSGPVAPGPSASSSSSSSTATSPPDAGTEPVASKKGCMGCVVVGSRSDASLSAWFAALLGTVAVARRRRTK